MINIPRKHIKYSKLSLENTKTSLSQSCHQNSNFWLIRSLVIQPSEITWCKVQNGVIGYN